MDNTQIAAEQVIARYLAGRLPATESDAFERYVSEHPEICDEIEQTLKFREGLARLRERGELSALLREPAQRRWLPYAAAAAVALATLGGVLWLQPRTTAPAVLFLSPNDLAAHQPGSPAILGSYVLVRTRGSSAVTDVKLPGAGAIELKILPSSVSPEARYRVALKRLDGSGSRGAAQIDAGSVAADGYVTIYVDAAQLPRGNYEVSLVPLLPGHANGDTDRFVIRVQ
jgi:hypothetical protein